MQRLERVMRQGASEGSQVGGIREERESTRMSTVWKEREKHVAGGAGNDMTRPSRVSTGVL